MLQTIGALTYPEVYVRCRRLAPSLCLSSYCIASDTNLCTRKTSEDQSRLGMSGKCDYGQCSMSVCDEPYNGRHHQQLPTNMDHDLVITDSES